jgi:hypothetical protein
MLPSPDRITVAFTPAVVLDMYNLVEERPYFRCRRTYRQYPATSESGESFIGSAASRRLDSIRTVAQIRDSALCKAGER